MDGLLGTDQRGPSVLYQETWPASRRGVEPQWPVLYCLVGRGAWKWTGGVITAPSSLRGPRGSACPVRPHQDPRHELWKVLLVSDESHQNCGGWEAPRPPPTHTAGWSRPPLRAEGAGYRTGVHQRSRRRTVRGTASGIATPAPNRCPDARGGHRGAESGPQGQGLRARAADRPGASGATSEGGGYAGRPAGAHRGRARPELPTTEDPAPPPR